MSAPTRDLSTWLTKRDAAERIGVSFKTLEKFVREGKLQSGKWRLQLDRPALAVYHPDDVERLARERQAELGAFVVPHAPEPLREASRTSPANADGFVFLLAQALYQNLREGSRSQPERLFLTLKEASQLTGLTQRYLRERIQAGDLEAVQDGRRLRIRRKDLEGL